MDTAVCVIFVMLLLLVIGAAIVGIWHACVEESNHRERQRMNKAARLVSDYTHYSQRTPAGLGDYQVQNFVVPARLPEKAPVNLMCELDGFTDRPVPENPEERGRLVQILDGITDRVVY